ELVLTPLAEGLEPTGSMGEDCPLAVLSRRPRLLYTYFKQLFAQVTNPPIDSVREKAVMSLNMLLGGRLELFEEFPESTGLAEIDSPILLHHEFAALNELPLLKGKITTLHARFPAASGPAGLEPALKSLAAAAEQAVRDGAKLI